MKTFTKTLFETQVGGSDIMQIILHLSLQTAGEGPITELQLKNT